jgi:hypothetical protein
MTSLLSCGFTQKQTFVHVRKEIPLQNQGIKYDNGKPRYDLLPVGAVEEIAKVYTFGCKKYAPHNWRMGIHYSRLFSAAQRHQAAFWGGESTDPESNLHHLAHAAFSLLAILQFELEEREHLDDRWTPLQEGGQVEPS